MCQGAKRTACVDILVCIDIYIYIYSAQWSIDRGQAAIDLHASAGEGEKQL